MRVDNLCDTFPRKRFLAETPLDIIEHLRMRWVALVQDVLQLEIRRAEAVAEVLREDPATICVQKSIQ